MPNWVWIVTAVVIADVVVFLIMYPRIKGPLQELFANLTGMRKLANELDQIVTEHMQANWSGHREQLPQALGTLLERARALAAAKGVGLGEDALRAVVVRMVAAKRFAGLNEAASAMDSVPRADAVRIA